MLKIQPSLVRNFHSVDEHWKDVLRVIARSCMPFFQGHTSFYVTGIPDSFENLKIKPSLEMTVIVKESVSAEQTHKLDHTVDDLRRLYPNIDKIHLIVITKSQIDTDDALQHKISDAIHVAGQSYWGKI
jgi:hypothetical protein